jgi:hypothetical protein
MKNLQEIVAIVSKKRVKNVEMLDKSTREDSLMYQLYDGIRTGQFVTDNDAAKKLVQSTPHDPRYRKLKSYLKKRVINNLFYLDINDPYYSSYHKAYYSCSKNAALLNILGSHGARHSAVDLAKKTLKQARKQTINEVILTCARFLKDHYSFTGQRKKFEEMEDLVHRTLRTLQAELRAEDMYQDLIINYAHSVASHKELTQVARNYLKEAQALAKRHFSFHIQYNLHKIKILTYLIPGKYKTALRACDDWDRFIAAHQHFAQDRITGRFLLYRLYCYLHLEDYKRSQSAAEQCRTLFTKGTNNYLIYLEYHFLVCMYASKFDEARAIYEEAMAQPKFAHTQDERKEKWRIFGAYLNYVDPDAHEQFNLAKFLNEVPIYEKDKRGYNVSIILIHILFLLKQGKMDQIYDRVDALSAYCSRWLSHEDNYRSNCFIKMLLIMTKEEFDYDRIEKLTAKYYAKLAATRFNYQGTMVDLEVIPYEKLWKLTMAELKAALVKVA